jgi:hypothetical protein
MIFSTRTVLHGVNVCNKNANIKSYAVPLIVEVLLSPVFSIHPISSATYLEIIFLSLKCI